MILRKIIGKILFIFMIGGFVAVTLYQVSDDGLFAPKKVSTTEVDSKVETLNGKLKALQEKYDALLKKSKIVETPKGTIEVVKPVVVSEANASK
jgi:beta-lactamase regulating signal transducer with metallopeptidase domain